jgi:hypothetical protein
LSRIAFIDAKCRIKGSKAGFTDGLIETNRNQSWAERLGIEKVRTGNGGEDLRKVLEITLGTR